MSCRLQIAVLRLALLAIPRAAVLAADNGIGIEFQVNTQTLNEQAFPAVAAGDAGFVVVWQSSLDGSSYGVFAQRFSSAGAALASEFQVNTYTTNSQRGPKVAMNATGAFVVAWDSFYQDSSAMGIFARRFSSTGTALAAEFQVTTFTSNNQQNSSVTMDAQGDFVVAWESNLEDGSYAGVFLRRFASNGDPIGGELQANTLTADQQRRAAVAGDADGDFVVVWQSYPQDGFDYGVFGQRFSSSGTRLGAEFAVNFFTLNTQGIPKVAMEADGDFVVVWQSRYDLDGYGIRHRRFASSGAPLAEELQVNTWATGDQVYPEVAILSSGRFVIAWQSPLEDGSGSGVFAQRFSRTDTPLAGEFRVNTYTTNAQARPSVAAGPGRGFLVAWDSSGQDGSARGIFAQRILVPIVLDVDGDGSVQPLTDTLLGLRYAFGFRGAALITGAVGPGCTRCDAPSIESYLSELND